MTDFEKYSLAMQSLFLTGLNHMLAMTARANKATTKSEHELLTDYFEQAATVILGVGKLLEKEAETEAKTKGETKAEMKPKKK
jgi:hypothetical protein